MTSCIIRFTATSLLKHVYTNSVTRNIWKMLGPFATVSRRTPIHQVSLLSHAGRRLRIDVHDNDDDDNAWQRGPLWPHRMGPITTVERPTLSAHWFMAKTLIHTTWTFRNSSSIKNISEGHFKYFQRPEIFKHYWVFLKLSMISRSKTELYTATNLNIINISFLSDWIT